MAKQSMWGNFFHALVAVLAGNAAYFLLMPYLPTAARHRTFHYDLGLVVDFLFCLVVFVVVKIVSQWGTRKSELRSQK
ncbi:MAG TPA: hypothetical protein VFJ47_16160 [Terriglobales bacterium]|nr:hypothetical protein [Terriglobales bacterium]